MSDSDAGGEQEQESKPTPRPVTAAARRERRASARPAGKAAAKDADKARPAKAASSTDGATKAEVKKGRATPKRDRKEKKPSLVARLVRFAREVWAELRKVIWPTRNQMVTYTSVVLVFVAFMVALVYLLDFVFRKGVFWLFG
ncbi:preprotein translocase subunit SecE [Amycolatopsis acidiphila]|uniref:preprotein translocase subunit SecE n=1 Tax=Amycolatopsis acidiphila TaxID=715473 RepID=UPI001643EFC5|nr:preprotein translocase subunit SecE [Amycolatopsis acidiphila]UIJ60656.1 preprotein translocase subunit SecE [Amycolatopsis acidiphila]GHG98259.1 protein translocase subunit SecE [Amycolatopsis acidiphila]